MSLHNKTAIITGGASGIGFAIATKLVQQNCNVVITGRNSEKLLQAKETLGEKCVAIQNDLDDIAGLPDLVQQMHNKFGRIDILVNNAGINMKKDFTLVSDEEFAKIMHTNVLAMFALSREVVKVMQQQKGGAILNISSMASQYGLPKVIAYTASKSAIEGMTRGMATELSPMGIRVNCIAPGFIKTEMSAKALNSDPERMQKVLSRTPIGTMGEVMDVAEAAWFLVSDSSAFITGIVLPVDGGNSIGF